MRIEFELKFRDYLAFTGMHQLLSVPVQIFYLGISMFWFFSIRGTDGLFVGVVGGIMVYIFLWAVQLFFNVLYLFLGKNPSIFTRHIIEIHDDAFYEETPFNRSYSYWHGVLRAVQRAGFVLVYVNANHAHIIPARAFSDKKQRSIFLETVCKHIAKGRQKVAR